VRPDKLRFDFTHGQSLSPEELRDVEDRVNEWISAGAPVRWLEMERPEAEALGAMALFGEKYGEWVRVVEIEGVSRELCGGTHVANTAEIGIFKVTAEGSSAANVRRIEAITGPAATDFFRERDGALREVGELLGNPQDPLAGARRAAERLKEAGAGAEQAQRQALGEESKRLAGEAYEAGGIQVLVAASELADQRALLEVANRIQSSLGDPVVQVLGGGDKDKVALVALASPGAIEKGLSAAELVRAAAGVVGGGGGGRDDMAQAGGRDPAKLDDALAEARGIIEGKLG
jgi:alanyl-tRNA synthetase